MDATAKVVPSKSRWRSFSLKVACGRGAVGVGKRMRKIRVATPPMGRLM
jgi:hypothetical protein